MDSGNDYNTVLNKTPKSFDMISILNALVLT
jgi:hypothetical protein